MNEKMLNARIVHKHDSAANWSNIPNFIPKAGELIVYDPDEIYKHQRLKLGDGETTIKNLPFLSETFSEDETIYANSDSITPIEVCDAVLNSKKVILSYIDSTYGLIIFTNFIVLGDIGFVVSTGNGQYNGEYFIFNLAGDMANGNWNFFYDTIALKSDLPIDWFKKGTKIPVNSDLNTYMTPGKYYCVSTADSKTVINSPVINDNFVLYVTARTSSDSSSLTQIIFTLNGVLHIRGCDSTNTWRAWRSFISNIDDEEFFTQPTEPSEAVDGDFWIDTSESTYVQKKIYESPIEPQNSQDGDMWIDTSDMV